MRTGDVVDGRFAILERAGVGGMGSVYRALDRQTTKLVAIKVLHAPDMTSQARFLKEAKALAGLEHPHVVRYVTHGISSDSEPYLVMEWLEGESLDRRLTREPLRLEDSLDLARRIAVALGSAHTRGIVHRDVKPSNVFLVDGAIDKVRLLDFGIARLDDASSGLTRTGNVLGTPGYMAPEQARGDKRYVDARADVFSLGCLLYECLSGQPPFHGPHPMAIITKLLAEDAPRLRSSRHDVPEALDALVARMLAKEPGARPADGAAVAAALDALSNMKSVEPPPPSIRSRAYADVFPSIPPSAPPSSDPTIGMAATMPGLSSLRELSDPAGQRPSSPPPEPRSSRMVDLPPPSVSPASDRRWFERLPRPAGRSPFRVKGIAYKGMLHYVSTRLDGGMPSLTNTFRDPILREYLTQPFLASSFYDFFPLVAASAGCASLANVQLEIFAQGQGRAQAKYDADHAYRSFVQGRSIDDFPSRFRLIAQRYYDFGEWEANSFSPGTITFVQRGIPAWAIPWYSPLQSGYISTLVDLVSNKRTSVTVYPTRRDGVIEGIQTVILEMDVSY
ncbi:serine/threonine-protein kinase [Polyangium sorediatum]|uniref:Serine/threonine-protein kinase n=1 Tax=Polyangium sorediatum TaxID=889274 RepID=A0ABT6P254_9BACT|nr:serine/threonine-protein kinase [Polyangium sorediatum]MDI1434634.1 serine/threonine-protein kinase [Polyangium sorediatum]